MQLRVLGLGLFQDGDIGVGVFPEGEEVFVSGERTHSGGISIRPLRSSGLQGVGPSHSQMRQRSRPAVPNNATVVEDLLELDGSLLALPSREIRLTAIVGRIKAGEIGNK